MQIVHIHAVDWSYVCEQLDHASAAALEVMEGHIIGWLVAEHPDRYQLAMHAFGEEGSREYRHVTTVPKQCVLEMRVIGEYPPAVALPGRNGSVDFASEGTYVRHTG